MALGLLCHLLQVTHCRTATCFCMAVWLAACRRLSRTRYCVLAVRLAQYLCKHPMCAAAAVALQVTAEFPGLSASGSDLQHLLTSCPSSLMYSWASPELVSMAARMRHTIFSICHSWISAVLHPGQFGSCARLASLPEFATPFHWQRLWAPVFFSYLPCSRLMEARCSIQ